MSDQEQEDCLAINASNQIPPTVVPHYPKLPVGVKKLADYPPATQDEQTERMTGFRRIVKEKQFQPVHWVNREGNKQEQTVDLFSASAVCQVYDALSEDKRAYFCALEPTLMVSFAFKLM